MTSLIVLGCNRFSWKGYGKRNCFTTLSVEERKNILDHMHYYHHGPESDNPTFQELANYFSRVFEGIKDDLECYLELCAEGTPTQDVLCVQKNMKEKFTRFEPADYLSSEPEGKAYLKAAIEEEDPCLFTIVLSDIAKARDIEEGKKASK